MSNVFHSHPSSLTSSQMSSRRMSTVDVENSKAKPIGVSRIQAHTGGVALLETNTKPPLSDLRSSHRAKRSVVKLDVNASPGSSKKRMMTFPLTAALVLQCLLVTCAFVVLVVMTSLMMNTATRNLVIRSISSDLQYARARILSPVQSYEHAAVSLRQNYIYLSKVIGTELCADSPHFMDSQVFYVLGATLTRINPSISYVFNLRRSDSRLHFPEGLPDVVECDVTPFSISAFNNASRISVRPVNLAEDVNNLNAIPFTLDPTDYFYEPYVPNVLSYTEVKWQPYLYVDPNFHTTELYLAGYIPIKSQRTFVNGSVEIYEPDIFTAEPSMSDVVSSVTLSTIGITIGMTQFIALMKSITPDVDGAHTSLYDLVENRLVCTSEGILLYNTDLELWPAGATSSSKINDAYSIFYSLGYVEASLAKPYFSGGDQAEVMAAVNTIFHNGDVVSSVRVTTTSGIDFLVVQSTPESHYFGPVIRLRNIMIIVGVVAAVAVVAVCLVVGMAIWKPLRKVEANMQLAAVLKNEQVVATTSVLTEIKDLCGAFDRMNDKLLQARAFMPQAMLLDSGSSDDDDQEDCNEGEQAAKSQLVVEAGLATKLSIASLSALRTEDLKSRAVTNPSSKGSTTVGIPSGAPPPLILKRVTILAINAKGFHDAVNVTVPATVAAPAAELTALIHSVCTTCRGVIDSFHGDHFVLSFNAAKTNAQGPQSAMRAALAIMHSTASSALNYYMGASTGRACVGHLGTATLKRLSIVGSVYSRALALEGVCRRVNGRAGRDANSLVQCVMDRAIAVELNHSHKLQVMGYLIGGPFTKEVDLNSEIEYVYGLREAREGKAVEGNNADEWLYEVTQLTSTDPMLVEVNNAVIEFLGATSAATTATSTLDLVGARRQSTKNDIDAARQQLHNALSRIAEMPMPSTTTTAIGAPFTCGRHALERARKVADGCFVTEFEV